MTEPVVQRVVAIVQARMSSTRLPGKSLMDVAGRPVLQHCVERLATAKHVDEVVVATSQEESDDPIAALCDALSIPCFRGSLDDVLGRYAAAARESQADVVVRVTGDCPLIEGIIVDGVIAAFRAARSDYAANVHERTVPLGGDTEVFTCAALHQADREAREPFEREHVTPFIYLRPERFQLLAVDSGLRRDLPYRLCVDTEADLALVRAIFERLGPGNRFPLSDAVTLLDAYPALAEMNAHVKQKTLEG